MVGDTLEEGVILLKLIILGAGSIIPTPSRFSSGILVDSEEAGKLLLDIGPGTIEKLRRINVNPNEIKAILITHLHIDHVADLLPLIKIRAYDKEKSRLKVYGPKGLRQFLDLLLRDHRLFGYLSRLGCIDLIDIREFWRGSTDLNNVKIYFTNVEHFNGVAYRLELEGRSIVYSGDTGPDPNLIELARGCDVLIHECSFPAEKLLGKHTSDRDLIRITEEIGPKILIVVHLYPEMEEKVRELVDGLREVFDGEIYVPKDLDVVEV